MVSVAVLAGGQSRRMGQDKAFLQVGDQPLIERVLARVRPLSDDVFICTNASTLYQPYGHRLVSDDYPNKATLGGIFSAIKAAQYPSVLVVACDMPFLNERLLRFLISLAGEANVIAPLIQPPQPETTHTIYSKHCLPVIEARLQANKLKVIGFFDEVSVRYIDRSEILPFDPDFLSFTNMNTPADLERVTQLANQRDKE